MLSMPTLDALVLTGLFGVSGVLHMAGPRFVRDAYSALGLSPAMPIASSGSWKY